MSLRGFSRLFVGLALLFSSVVLAGVRDVASAAPSAPPYVLSNYVNSLDYSAWGSYGCEQVEYSTNEGLSSISLLLDFNEPWDSGNQYGTLIFNGDFAQWDSGGTSGIRYLVAEFLTGYWNCSTSNSPILILFIGVNNYPGTAIDDTTNAYWMGEVIAAEDRFIDSEGWSNEMLVYGGIDAETEWSSYATTVAYLNEVYTEGQWPIFDFGDAGGCPDDGYQANTKNCNDGWEQSQVWEVSWGEAYAYPFPEIYATAGGNAQEWYWIDRLSLGTTGYPMVFQGVLTQYTACSQVPPCSGTDNTPAEGWTQLYNALGQNSGTASGKLSDLVG